MSWEVCEVESAHPIRVGTELDVEGLDGEAARIFIYSVRYTNGRYLAKGKRVRNDYETRRTPEGDQVLRGLGVKP